MTDYSSDIERLRNEISTEKAGATSLEGQHSDANINAMAWSGAASALKGSGAVSAGDVVTSASTGGATLAVSGGLYAAGIAAKWIAERYKAMAASIKNSLSEAKWRIKGSQIALLATHVKRGLFGTTTNRQKGQAPISIREQLGDVGKKIQRTSIRLTDPKDVLRGQSELSKKPSFYVNQTAMAMGDAETKAYDEFLSSPGDAGKETAFLNAHLAKRIAENCKGTMDLDASDALRQKALYDNKQLARFSGLMAMSNGTIASMNGHQLREALDLVTDDKKFLDPSSNRSDDPARDTEIGKLIGGNLVRLKGVLDKVMKEKGIGPKEPDERGHDPR